MIANELQQTLFQQLKEQLPAHLSLADEVASLLEISSDSAYRRIRGEKSISLEELQKICSRFKLSVDQVLNLQTDAFLFNGHLFNSSEYSFETWMQTDIKILEQILSFKQRHLYYLAKEIPFFFGDNTVLVKTNSFEVCFLNHNAINYFFTRNKRFVTYTKRFLENVKRKSILISSAGEKERVMFFNHTRGRIDISRQKLARAKSQSTNPA